MLKSKANSACMQPSQLASEATISYVLLGVWNSR